MADETVLVNISEMIDLAIGTPEVGVVDFNMLQTVLHCLAQQLRVLGKNVQLRGSVATMVTTRENSQTIAISEFAVDTRDGQPTDAGETMLVVERVKKRPEDQAGTQTQTAKPMTPTPQATQATGTGATGTGVSSATEKVSLVTQSKFNILENTVNDLKDRVYGSMPKNETILEEVRSQTNLKAITDMWTSLNVSSRLEAAENGIAKLSSLVQDLIAADNPQAAAALSKALNDVGGGPTSAVQDSQTTAGVTISIPTNLDPATQAVFAAVKSNLEQQKAEIDALANTLYSALRDLQGGQGGTSAPGTPRAPGAPGAPGAAGALGIAAMGDKMMDLEQRLKLCCDNIDKKTGVLTDKFNSIQDQLEYFMKQGNTQASQDLASGKISPELIKELQGLMGLFQTVQDMQRQLQNVHDTALQLAAEKEDREENLNTLLEQIELLKVIKLDREDMVEAMADKADLRMLARKVSHDQFETACDDLAKGLEQALGKLNLQEALWQQALDDIQREIETKLDKIELSPVKEFFNNKLKQLQENLKQMASLRREAEAAGTKRKLLRDVNCLSCDAQAVMAMEVPSILPVGKALPPTLSMKPYLSYELDAIRKTQASNLPHRNMRDWEAIDKQMSGNQPHRVRSATNKHLCNRYCGGSHTVTTPAQRVARLGHFIKQWGPDVLPLSSGLAAGDDGKMYRVTPEAGQTVGPGGAVEGPTASKKPEIKISKLTKEECRCLEGQLLAKQRR